jgi:hypothetical protein
MKLTPFLPILLCVGCATKTPPPPAPVVNRSPVGTVDNVRFGEVVKAYPIERYRDPADPRIMHEKHVAYRVEADSAWRLQANRNQQVIIGNTVTDSRTSKKPFSSQELTAEVERSRQQNMQVIRGQAEIGAMLKSTNSALSATAEAQGFTLRKLATLEAKMNAAEEARKKAEEERKNNPRGAQGDANDQAQSPGDEFK